MRFKSSPHFIFDFQPKMLLRTIFIYKKILSNGIDAFPEKLQLTFVLQKERKNEIPEKSEIPVWKL